MRGAAMEWKVWHRALSIAIKFRLEKSPLWDDGAFIEAKFKQEFEIIPIDSPALQKTFLSPSRSEEEMLVVHELQFLPFESYTKLLLEIFENLLNKNQHRN